MSVRYAWRPGSRVSIDADKAGRELARIEKAAGELTPTAVLERARSANSSLHDHFEWDDSVAAAQHRLSQAGELIRSITVDVTHSNIEPAKSVRAFVSVERPSGRAYMGVQRAMSDEEIRKQVLARAWAELTSFRQRYADLEELAVVFSAMDRLKAA
ncbi:hypothetical protein [Brevundimonas nasdae]|uniref:hypothetical protein n=1 Tax=Brevundimonas nasdae TaxID=172043 RepID=UPI0028991C31|nr:hypothetical protein [Brevundimonas nasdae]